MLGVNPEDVAPAVEELKRQLAAATEETAQPILLSGRNQQGSSPSTRPRVSTTRAVEQDLNARYDPGAPRARARTTSVCGDVTRGLQRKPLCCGRPPRRHRVRASLARARNHSGSRDCDAVNDLELVEKMGRGNFGEVGRGEFQTSGPARASIHTHSPSHTRSHPPPPPRARRRARTRRAGARGRVCRAIRRTTGQHFAVKRLEKSRTRTLSSLRLIANEIVVLQKLTAARQPAATDADVTVTGLMHVTGLIDIMASDDYLYLLLEPGGDDLHKLSGTARALNLPLIVIGAIARGLSAAVAAIHGIGWVHRDIAQNVLIGGCR